MNGVFPTIIPRALAGAMSRVVSCRIPRMLCADSIGVEMGSVAHVELDYPG
jgi:hypothetical protein